MYLHTYVNEKIFTLYTVPKAPEPSTLIFLNSVSLRMRSRAWLGASPLGVRGSTSCRHKYTASGNHPSVLTHPVLEWAQADTDHTNDWFPSQFILDTTTVNCLYHVDVIGFHTCSKAEVCTSNKNDGAFLSFWVRQTYDSTTNLCYGLPQYVGLHS